MLRWPSNPKEVDQKKYLATLPEVDRNNLLRVGDWFQRAAGQETVVWAVGSTVRNARRRRPKMGKGNDLDVVAYTSEPNSLVITRVGEALRTNPPAGFRVNVFEQYDPDTGSEFFRARVFPPQGRTIHLLPPKPYDMEPEEERVCRGGLFGRPFCQLRFRQE